MGQYEVIHQCDRKCSDCRFFNIDERWVGEEEHFSLICMKGHEKRVCWGRVNCKDFDPNGDA